MTRDTTERTTRLERWEHPPTPTDGRTGQEVRGHQTTGTCDLCGLRIDGDPIVKTIEGEDKHFCCQGCANVYEVAFENDMLDQVVQKPKVRKSPTAVVKDVFLDPGETAYFSLKGMWCAGCAVAAERVLKKEPGIKGVDVSFAAERGRIRYDPEVADPKDVLNRLSPLGYQGHVLTDRGESAAARHEQRMVLQLIVAAAFGMQVMIFYLVQLYPRYAAGDFGATDVRRLQYLVWLLATPSLFYGGLSFLKGAWRALRAGTATMDTLVALGTLSAYSYSVYIALTGSGEAYFDSVAMITLFVLFGRYLETVGGTQARKDIRKLLQLQPETARRRARAPSEEGPGNGPAWLEVKAVSLDVDDVILVRPGERVPVDAEIIEGDGTANEALLTGESAPVDKAPGDTLYSGTVVNDAAVIARVTRPVGTTRLAQITQLVEQTLSAKPPIQRLADKASAYFAFGILGAAVVTAAVRLVLGQAASEATLAAVAVLVVACPCALGLATPLALTVTLGRTTRAGLLVRNPTALETTAKLQRMVFDKTGTLTEGTLSVTEVTIAPGSNITSDELLHIAAAVEQFSEHPIARAIVAASEATLPEAEDFRPLRGLGASARIDERRVMVGSARFLEVSEDSPLVPQARRRAERGDTIVWVGGNWPDLEGAAGYIALRDTPNPTASEALARLRSLDIRPVMLSGDTPNTAAAIAEELDLEAYEGDCLPSEKAEYIKTWQAQGETVAMVGDGVNDAPALAQADLSFTAVGGADVAGETSDIVLTHADLTIIPWYVALSRRTRRIILENLGWAFAYNVVAVPLAAVGVISPVIAAATMASSSLLVVGNSLRLRR